MKNVCFDLRALQIGHQHRGIGVYVKNILQNLPVGNDTNVLFYAFDTSNPIEDLDLKIDYPYTLIQTKKLNTALNSPRDFMHVIRLVYHRFISLKQYRPLTFVQFDFTLGTPRYRNVKKIVLMYDLIPLILRAQYLPKAFHVLINTPGKRQRLRAFLRAAYYEWRFSLHYRMYKKADKIISISNDTSEMAKKLLPVKNVEINTILLAPDSCGSQKRDYSNINNIKKPFLFYIGGTDKRKHVDQVVKAFNIVRSRGLDVALVLAGNEFRKPSHIPDIKTRLAVKYSPYRKDIYLVGFVSDTQKMSIYERSFAFIMTSYYEGFGLPLIEAMQVGCPVIAYDNSSIKETTSDAAILVDTGDYVSIANHVLSLRDTKKRNNIINKGMERAAEFSWKKTANQTWESITAT